MTGRCQQSNLDFFFRLPNSLILNSIFQARGLAHGSGTLFVGFPIALFVSRFKGSGNPTAARWGRQLWDGSFLFLTKVGSVQDLSIYRSILSCLILSYLILSYLFKQTLEDPQTLVEWVTPWERAPGSSGSSSGPISFLVHVGHLTKNWRP